MQNNNNNNNNNINDNNNNINIANSNLNQNNDNAVTAGRRLWQPRRNFEDAEKMRKMLAAHVLHSKAVASSASALIAKPRIQREKRDFHKELVQQCLLASFMFMDAWQHLETGLDPKMEDLCHIQDALAKIGPWATIMGRPLALGISETALSPVKTEQWRLLAESKLQCATPPLS